jgi:hypothetical protein
MTYTQFACPRCFNGEEKQLELWIKEVSVMCLTVYNKDMSAALWSVTRCDCGRGLVSEQNSELPFVVEWVAMEAAAFYKDSRIVLQEVQPLPASYGRGLKRTTAMADAVVWLAVVVTSGVIGNYAHEFVKYLVMRVRRRDTNLLSLEQQEALEPLLLELDTLPDDELERMMRILDEYCRRRLDQRIRKKLR